MPPTRSNGTAAKACLQCGSTKLRRSHSRGPYEKLLKYFGQRAYRCKDCGWRGRINAKGRTKRKTSVKSYTMGKLIFIAVVILITIYLLIYLVNWANQDSGSQAAQSSGSLSPLLFS